MTASVVRNSAAMDAAFCRAERVTLAGSMMPAANMSTYSPVAAFRPKPGSSDRTFSATTPPSRPALIAICLSGSSSARRTDCVPRGPAPHMRALGLVPRQLELLERELARLEQGHAATGDDTLLDRGLGVAHRVLDAVLALLALDLGRRAGLDDGHAASQLGQPLLQLLPVVVRVGV